MCVGGGGGGEGRATTVKSMCYQVKERVCCKHGHSWVRKIVAHTEAAEARGLAASRAVFGNGWEDEVTGTIECDDLLAMAAAVYIYVKLHFSPQPKYPRSSPELLTAFTALLARRQFDDVPEVPDGYTIQQVAHREFRMLQHLGCRVTILQPTHALHRCLPTVTHPAAAATARPSLPRATRKHSLTFLAKQLAATYTRDIPFSVTSTARQIGMAASDSTVSPSTEALTFERSSFESLSPLSRPTTHHNLVAPSFLSLY